MYSANHIQSCESLSLDECEICMHNESACPLKQQSFLKCQIEYWGKCDSKSECESQGEVFSDQDAIFEYAQRNLSHTPSHRKMLWQGSSYQWCLSIPKNGRSFRPVQIPSFLSSSCHVVLSAPLSRVWLCRNITSCFLTPADGWDPPNGLYTIDHGYGPGVWHWYMQADIRLYGDFWGYWFYNFRSEDDCLNKNPDLHHWTFSGILASLTTRLMLPAKTEEECTNNYGYGCEVLSPNNQVPGTTLWVQSGYYLFVIMKNIFPIIY